MAYKIKPAWMIGIVFLVVAPLLIGYIELALFAEMPIILYYLIGFVLLLILDYAIIQSLFKSLGKSLALAVNIILPFLQAGLMFTLTGTL